MGARRDGEGESRCPATRWSVTPERIVHTGTGPTPSEPQWAALGDERLDEIRVLSRREPAWRGGSLVAGGDLAGRHDLTLGQVCQHVLRPGRGVHGEEL